MHVKTSVRCQFSFGVLFVSFGAILARIKGIFNVDTCPQVCWFVQMDVFLGMMGSEKNILTTRISMFAH